MWQTQKAFENNGLYVCPKGWFDGGTGAGEWVMNARPGDFYYDFGRHLTFTDLWVFYRNRLGPDT